VSDTKPADDLAPFEGTRRRCPACAWPVMKTSFVPDVHTSIDTAALAHLRRKCEQCGFELKEQCAPPGVDEHGATITGT
jgi:hypothetical protein